MTDQEHIAALIRSNDELRAAVILARQRAWKASDDREAAPADA